MVHAGIFTIQKVFFIHCFNMQNVQTNASLSRGKIKLQEKSISPKELSLESLSFSPGDLLKHQMPPGISQLLWVNCQFLWSLCLPFSGWNFYKPTHGNGNQLSHSLPVIGFWAVFSGGELVTFSVLPSKHLTCFLPQLLWMIETMTNAWRKCFLPLLQRMPDLPYGHKQTASRLDFGKHVAPFPHGFSSQVANWQSFPV